MNSELTEFLNSLEHQKKSLYLDYKHRWDNLLGEYLINDSQQYIKCETAKFQVDLLRSFFSKLEVLEKSEGLDISQFKSEVAHIEYLVFYFNIPLKEILLELDQELKLFFHKTRITISDKDLRKTLREMQIVAQILLKFYDNKSFAETWKFVQNCFTVILSGKGDEKIPFLSGARGQSKLQCMSVFLSFLLDPQGSCEFDKWRIEDENFQIELPITEFKFNGYFFIYYLYSKQFEKPFKLLRKDFDKHKVRFVRRHNKSYISLKTVENSVNDETKGQFENSKQII